MYDKDGFNSYFMNVVGASRDVCATYRSFLKKIDAALGDLDEALDRRGLEDVMTWAKDTDVEPFGTYRSSARSVLKRYGNYRLSKIAGISLEDDELGSSSIEPVEIASVESDANFIREKEMQVQVRRQLTSLEEGLRAIDDGVEVQVATGRIDILARDAQGGVVVVELKAGKCPPGALEQLLGYSYDLEQERGIPVRAMLVAGSFSDRLRAAARRAGVELRTYAYSLSFQSDV